MGSNGAKWCKALDIAIIGNYPPDLPGRPRIGTYVCTIQLVLARFESGLKRGTAQVTPDTRRTANQHSGAAGGARGPFLRFHGHSRDPCTVETRVRLYGYRTPTVDSDQCRPTPPSPPSRPSRHLVHRLMPIAIPRPAYRSVSRVSRRFYGFLDFTVYRTNCN